MSTTSHARRASSSDLALLALTVPAPSSKPRLALPCSIVRSVRGEDLEFTVELDLRDDGVILSGKALVLAHERTSDGKIAFERGSRIELTPSEFSAAQKRRPYLGNGPGGAKTFAQIFGFSRNAGERLSDFI